MEGEITMEATIIREETLPARETLTPLGGNREHSDKEYRLNELVSVNIFITEDKTISNAEFVADAVSCQSSDDELF